MELITEKTKKIVVITLIAFGLILLLIWLLGYGKSVLDKLKGGNGKDSGKETNQDGTPVVWPSTVDKSYIQRIAGMAKTVHDERDFSGYSGTRCEVVSNIISMRGEEITMLVYECKTSYGFMLKADVNQYTGDGCLLSENIAKAQAKLQNY